MTIALVGDLHGDLWTFNQDVLPQIPAHAQVIQVGDYGIRWPRSMSAHTDPKCRVDFIAGNHEYYPLLRPHMRQREPVQVAPNSWFRPSGSVAIIDDRRVGFLGGAESVDRARRVVEVSWWPDESITHWMVERLLVQAEQLGGLDLLVTHTPPRAIVETMLARWSAKAWPEFQHSAKAVEGVWDALGRPRLICGHMHDSFHAFGVTVLAINEVRLF